MTEASKKIGSKKYKDWEEGKAEPTLKQVKRIAQKLYVPYGYLFLSNPPEEKLPIPDFRTIKNKELSNPSIELLDTIYDAQRKQDWLREEKIRENENKVITPKKHTAEEIINKIKEFLAIDKIRKEEKDYENFLKALIERLHKKEFLIIRNGVVGNNTHRPLEVEEFKGFALFDEYAPLIFINGKDHKSSQIFTLIHELVHLFLNESALDGGYDLQTEQNCNKLAAEILLPGEELKRDFQKTELEKIANTFKVSVFVVLIKAKQSGLINEKEFKNQWKIYQERVKEKTTSKSEGGNFYRNVNFRAGGENFLFRVGSSTLAGETLYRDAYALTGLRGKTFDTYYKKAGFPL